MSKFLLAVLLAVTAVSARAEDSRNFAHVQYTFRDTVAGQSGDTNRQGVNFTVGRRVTDSVTIDLGEQFRTEKLNSDNGANTTRLEAGATYQYGLTSDVALYARGATGYKFTTNQDYAYYSVEPGVKVAVTGDLSVRAGYRFRDSYSDTYNEKTNTVRFGAEYTVAKDQTVTLGIDRSYGASEFIGYNFGYAVKF